MACYREEIEKLRSLRDAQQSFRLIDAQISANFEERFTLSLESAAMYLTGKSLPQLLREEGEDLDPDFDQEYEMSLEEASLESDRTVICRVAAGAWIGALHAFRVTRWRGYGPYSSKSCAKQANWRRERSAVSQTRRLFFTCSLQAMDSDGSSKMPYATAAAPR